MKYSIIITYRNREEHLTTLLPRLKDVFANESYEIIVAEQDNNEKFQKNSLYNIASTYAKGELLVFHDVDYYPSDDVMYNTDEQTPLYPVRRVVFLDKNGELRTESDIPAGYRNFKYDVGDHSGGVFVLSRTLFDKINGLNPYYKGWGMEDDDTRQRIRYHGYEWKRNENGLFFSLYHEDSRPLDSDTDFQNNMRLLMNQYNTLTAGRTNVTADVDSYNVDEVTTWLKITNFKYS
jgi:predicted glycosyltransferase involved in capsule biosynthesis